MVVDYHRLSSRREREGDGLLEIFRLQAITPPRHTTNEQPAEQNKGAVRPVAPQQ